ncbi:MAG: hypothetical protein SWH61_00890 [Thermodesulfobacteriota bacterium]|nr:hypothetical protein [Thermodesulfobacteriota bacterium]
MADLYFLVWETVTSLTIILLVVAYIVYSRMAGPIEAIDNEDEKTARLNSLKAKTRSIVGGLFLMGGIIWLYYIQTHEIYITKSLRGPHDMAPPIIMSLIGLVLLGLGIRQLRTDRVE